MMMTAMLISDKQFKTNILLSVMAFADLGFLCAMLPGSLASFPFAYQSSCFRWYFYKTKLYFHTMANLFSAVSTWYAVFASQVSQLNYSTKLQYNNVYISRFFLQ